MLVRAVEQVSGIAPGVRTDGPGRLTRALGITRVHNAADLVAGSVLAITTRRGRPRIVISARIDVGYAGAIAEAPWRFFDAASTHVSRPHPRTIGLGALPSG